MNEAMSAYERILIFLDVAAKKYREKGAGLSAHHIVARGITGGCPMAWFDKTVLDIKVEYHRTSKRIAEARATLLKMIYDYEDYCKNEGKYEASEIEAVETIQTAVTRFVSRR